MFTRTHATNKNTMQKEVYNHICEIMRNIHRKEGNKITAYIEQKILEQANIDLAHIMRTNNLITYYNRMKAGQI